jgi:hypothetical protein
MAAIIKYVRTEDVDILKKYLSDGGVALIFPKAQKKAAKMDMHNDDYIDYDFGGEPDVAVEMVITKDHYLFRG